MLKKRVIFLTLLLLVVGGFLWFYSHALLDITIDDSAAGFNYSVSPQGATSQKELMSKTNHVTKIVSKGSYELLVRQNQNSSFKLFKTSGFLSKTIIHAKLIPENARQFVGDNPGPCMNYTGQILISSGCGDSYKNLQLHVPATSSLSTHTLSPTSRSNGIVQGIFNIKPGTFALLKYSVSGYIIYQLDNALQLSNPIGLSNLSPAKSYSVTPYKDGFLVYSSAFDEFFYYGSATSAPQTLQIEKATDPKLKPYAVSVQGNTIAVMYTSVSDTDNNDVAPSVQKGKTEVVLQNDNKAEHFHINKIYSGLSVCGQSKLCLLNKNLEVYDVSTQSPRLIYKIGGVTNIFSSQSDLVVVRDKEVLEFNVDNENGYAGYSFGDYKYCGASTDSTGYTLCLINNKSKKVALRINEKAVDQDSVDKKVAGLLKSPGVKNVSIYDSHIFISPDLGEPVATENGFIYPDSIKASAGKQIDAAVLKLGFDKSKFTIVNLIP